MHAAVGPAPVVRSSLCLMGGWLVGWRHFCGAEMDPDDGLLTDYGLAAAEEASLAGSRLGRREE